MSIGRYPGVLAAERLTKVEHCTSAQLGLFNPSTKTHVCVRYGKLNSESKIVGIKHGRNG
jgi:hypothetical protein